MKVIHSLAVVGLLLTAAPALADNPQMVAQAKPQAGVAACEKFTPISDVQRKQLQALQDRYELDTAQKKAELHVSYRQLKEVLSALTIDKAQAQALQAKINGLRDDLANARLGMHLAAADVFTPEQRAQFSRMHHFHHHHFGGHFGEKGPKQS